MFSKQKKEVWKKHVLPNSLMRPVEESTVPASPEVKASEPQCTHEYRMGRTQGPPGPRPPQDRDPTPPPGGLMRHIPVIIL